MGGGLADRAGLERSRPSYTTVLEPVHDVKPAEPMSAMSARVNRDLGDLLACISDAIESLDTDVWEP
eukprot:1328010-Pyramimonas_sp.AAC.1